MSDSTRKNRLTLAVAVLVIAVLLIQLVAFRVRETERAVVKTFGKATRKIEEPGLYWKWPWPVEEVVRQDARLRVLEGPLDETTTADKRSLLAACFVTWRPGDPTVFLERVQAVEVADQKLASALRSAQNAAFGRFDFEALISNDRSKLRWEEVEKEIRAPLEKLAREELGIEVVLVGIRRIALPKDTTDTVFGRMRAERDEKAKELLAKGQAEADGIRARAESERTDLLNQALAEARKMQADAEAKSRAAHQVLDQNPELAIHLRKVEALRRALETRTTLVLDTTAWPWDLLAPRPSGEKK